MADGGQRRGLASLSRLRRRDRPGQGLGQVRRDAAAALGDQRRRGVGGEIIPHHHALAVRPDQHQVATFTHIFGNEKKMPAGDGNRCPRSFEHQGDANRRHCRGTDAAAVGWIIPWNFCLLVCLFL